MPGNVELGDVAPAVGGRWQQPQEGEVLHATDPAPDRFGALHQSVLGRWAEDAELERNPASRAAKRGARAQPSAHTDGAAQNLSWPARGKGKRRRSKAQGSDRRLELDLIVVRCVVRCAFAGPFPGLTPFMHAVSAVLDGDTPLECVKSDN
jgi:hypothetical protein